jgi:hypothetical protein
MIHFRLHTLPTPRVPHIVWICKALNHCRGECLGVYFEAFTKACRRPIARKSYNSRANHTLLSDSTLAKAAAKRTGLYPLTSIPFALSVRLSDNLHT